MFTRRSLIGSTPLVLAASALGANLAQAQPAKTMRLIVGFPPGAGTDIIARLVSDSLRTDYPGAIVVENRVGAGGRLAVNYVKAAPADGQTILVTSDFPLTVYPHSYSNVGYDPKADLNPIAVLGVGNIVLCVGPLVPESVRTVEEYLSWCKKGDKNPTFGSVSGSSFHFAGLMLGKARGVDLLHVGYRGMAPAVQDTIAGQIPACLVSVTDCLQFHKAGKARILGSFGKERDPFVPDVPTMAEAGFKDVSARVWVGAFAPRGTPQDVVERLNKHMTRYGDAAGAKERLAAMAITPTHQSPAESRQMLHDDLALWGPVIKASGFKADD